MNEVKQAHGSCFVTLTYDDVHLPPNGTLVVSHCQNFFKRLRKNIHPRKVRYFLGAEYGDVGRRPHYHAILFGLTKEDTRTIERSWGLGFVHVGDVTHDSACYVARYTEKKLYGDGRIDYVGRKVIPEFGLMSSNPGIGAAYADQNKNFIKQNAFVIVKGSKVSLPRYYAARVFTTDHDKLELKQKRQKFFAEAFEASKLKSGKKSVSDILWYQKHESHQGVVNLKARQGLKRRKL